MAGLQPNASGAAPPPVPPSPPGPPTPPGGCYVDSAVSYKFAPGNLFPDAPNHGVQLTDSAAGCCKICLAFKNCSFYTFEHGGTAAQLTCYSKPGSCCFLKTAAAAGGALGATKCHQRIVRTARPDSRQSRVLG